MRHFVFVVLLVCGSFSASAEAWSVVGRNGYGCKSIEDIAQLRLMSAVKAALEIALADKIEGGACVKLLPGEPASKHDVTATNNRAVFKVKRADGTEYFVDPRFVERTF